MFIIMKTNNIIPYYLFALICFLVSCSDDFFQYNEIEEGIPTSLVINCKSADNIIESRVGRDETEEKKINNIYLFIFDKSGNKVFNSKYTNLASGTIQIENINSMNSATLVGIANVGITDYILTDENLNNVASEQDLEDLVVTINYNTIERYNSFLMVGKVENLDIEAGNTPTKADLFFRRIDAKVRFEVTSESGNTAWTDFSFNPKNWCVKRIPAKSYLMEREIGDYEGSTSDYFQTKELTFEEVEKGAFTFYMPENRKNPKMSINIGETAAEKYAQREAWKKSESGERVFLNANDNSTYVEITGLLSYKDENQKDVNADVRFIVHLGYAEGNPDDYNTYRNTFYTYKVTVKGIKDIEVEVDDNIERRPGYEGDVVYTENQSFTFDSHYDRRLITMDPRIIDDKIGISWSVNTPFSRGVYKIGSGDVPKDLKDYRWIKFAINKDYGVDDNSRVKYPGDQNYNDPYPLDPNNNDKPSPYYTKGNPSFGAPDDKDHSSARLLDINQLCERLKQEHDAGATEPIAITVFVDEYLYFKHPIYDTGNDEELSLWKLTTDKQDRTLHLIVKDAQSSDDGNSSKVTAQFSFKQRTIQTVYNADKQELTTAWGLESVMETERMFPGGISSSATDLRNGRLNTLKSILGNDPENNKGVKWTDILGVDKDYSLIGDQYAVRACLLRNRDINGDNIVDANEIRWYLASIDQLTDIFLGEYALDEQSRLYPKNSSDREGQVLWHYTSSSAYENSSWVLWAEEGASRGSADDSKMPVNNKGEKLFPYRCVRNLGLPLQEVNQVPEELVKDEMLSDGNYLVDVTNMNIRSLRSSSIIDGKLAVHDERSDWNRPYSKFIVHKDVFPTPDYSGGALTGSWNHQDWTWFQTNNPSTDKSFRVPNQRELLIMTTRCKNITWKEFVDYDDFWGSKKTLKPIYVCYTKFSLNGTPDYGNNRKGFMWRSDISEFFLYDGQKGYLRPIKDYVE